MSRRPYKLRDNHRHHHHSSRIVTASEPSVTSNGDREDAVVDVDATLTVERNTNATIIEGDADVDDFDDYDIGDDWLSEDEQLFSLLVDDVERQTREAQLQLPLPPTDGTAPPLLQHLSAVSQQHPLHPNHHSLRRSITDIEDYYATNNLSGPAGLRSPKVPRRGGRPYGSLDNIAETSFFKNQWKQEQEQRQRQGREEKNQDKEGEGGIDQGTAAIPGVGTSCVWGVDSPASPEGRRRDRERDAVLAEQQVAEFTASENTSQNLPSTTSLTVDYTESQILGAHDTTFDPTVSLLSPPHLRGKSPLELFRSKPRKTLSVTDLVSPAWCELQYWYTLAYHGRKPATEAMKKGTEAHKTLEEQVHTTVPVDVMTREDGWALRIWNLIQGLRTLRETGVTRELEVWGVVDGELVTGIIDQIATECPDAELEKEERTKYEGIKTRVVNVKREESMTLDQYLMKNAGGQTMSVFEAMMGGQTADNDAKAGEEEARELKAPKKRGRKKKETRYYITDIKTRGGKSASVPTMSSTSFKPTALQLQLYYHILTRLVTTDDVTIEKIADRHTLDIDLPFSDSFIAQVAGIQAPEFAVKKRKSRNKKTDSASSDSSSDAESLNAVLDYDDILPVMLKHNTLRTLWPLMKAQLSLTFLPQSAQHNSNTPQPEPFNGDNTLISPLVTATYILPHSAESPTAPLRLLGSRSFIFKPDMIYPYLEDIMRWWRGYRPTKGVAVWEAWKCGFCDFRDICSWRKKKEEELAEKAAAARIAVEEEGKGKGKGDEEEVLDEEVKETKLEGDIEGGEKEERR